MMNGDPTAEVLIRGVAVGAFLLVALRLGAGGRTPARITGVLILLTAAGHTFTQMPGTLQALGPLANIAWAFSVAGAGFVWAFALELFGDHRRLSPWRLAPGLLLLAIAIVARTWCPTSRLIWVVHNLIGAALMLHALTVIWTGWRGDLVEARRRLRGPLLAVAAGYTLVLAPIQIGEMYFGPTHLSMLAAVLLLGLAFAAGVVFLRDDPDLLGAAGARSPVRRNGGVDEPLLQRLNEALDRDEVWREEGLTIGGLATRLGAAEHHLRRLINEGLGYRNFAAFLNERRIAAAKLALADPAKARVAVSTIAFEVGFSSLAPFNRAFREATGQAPSDWRKAQA